MSFDDDAFARRSPEPEKSKNTCLILGIIGIALLLLLMLCGGCIYVMYLGGSPLMEAGFDELERQLLADLEGNPVLEEHLGTIQSADLELWQSAERQQTEGDQAWVFRVEGTEGSGTLLVDGLVPGDPSSRINAAQLELDNGEVYDLFAPESEILMPSVDGPAEERLDGAVEDVMEAQPNSEQVDEFTRQVRVDIAEHPVILDHLGEITAIQQDTVRSNSEPGPNVYVFRVTGSKASGLLRADCITVSPEEEDVVAGELILDSGQRVQLFPENPLK